MGKGGLQFKTSFKSTFSASQPFNAAKNYEQLIL